MGTWIEISPFNQKIRRAHCRSLQWERGLKYRILNVYQQRYSRSLQWERGLKCLRLRKKILYNPSFPAMGTWIEMAPDPVLYECKIVVPCNGNVD